METEALTSDGRVKRFFDWKRFDSDDTLKALFLAAVFGMLAIGVYALQSPELVPGAAIASFGALVAGASLLLGAFFGFLFGIRRSLQQDSLPDALFDQLDAIEADVPSTAQPFGGTG